MPAQPYPQEPNTMVNPIKSIPIAVPTELTHSELPASMPRASAPVSPSEHTHRPSTSTSGQRHNDPSATNETPIDKTLEQLNDSMQAWATGMRFDVDEDAQRIVVSIVDSTSGEVLRTVPSEAVIRIAKLIVQLQGSAIDTRA